MYFEFSERMNYFAPGIFNLLNDKKEQLCKEGKEVYNLSVGTPDFEPDQFVIDALIQAAREPKNFKYALNDLPQLIKAVRNWYERRYHVSLTEQEVMSVYGSQEGLTHIGFCLCDPGDIVLVPNPGYPIFQMGPFLSGAEIIPYSLRKEKGYLPDFDSIPAAIAEKAKFIIVSYPANPVSTTAPAEFYQDLVAFAKKYNIIVIHDNAYSELVYDGEKGISFLSIEGAKDIGVELNSLSKSYNLTGCRISFVVGNKEIIQKFKVLRSQIDYGIFLPIQYAAIAALNGPQDSIKKHREEYQKRRDALCGGLRKIGWNVPDCKGTMFVWAPLPKGYESSIDFCMELLEKTGVICVPGSSFGTLGEGYIRFALVEPVERMQKIVEVIQKSGMIQ